MLNRFTKAATGKSDVDPDFVRAANDKLAELMGMETAGGQDGLPQKQPDGAPQKQP
jgi:hypothetical protein